MTKSIESLPQLVAEGKLTKREAAKIIWEDMYLYPMKYGLSLRNDAKSEFLLYLQERIDSIFDDYEPGKILFRTYIWGLVKQTYQTWKRKRRKEYADEESIKKSLTSIYDDIIGKHYEQEIKSMDDDDEEVKEQWKRKEREMTEKAALILALKSCYDIDEKLVESVSKFSHINKSTLFEKIEKMKEKSEHKIRRRNAIIRSRDNAFYYHRKYRIELSKLKEGTSSFERVQKKYQQQTERWIRQNNLLAHRYILSPSNVDVAGELGMKPRQVCFYINHIRKRKTDFKNSEREGYEREPPHENDDEQ